MNYLISIYDRNFCICTFFQIFDIRCYNATSSFIWVDATAVWVFSEPEGAWIYEGVLYPREAPWPGEVLLPLHTYLP